MERESDHQLTPGLEERGGAGGLGITPAQAPMHLLGLLGQRQGDKGSMSTKKHPGSSSGGMFERIKWEPGKEIISLIFCR